MASLTEALVKTGSHPDDRDAPAPPSSGRTRPGDYDRGEIAQLVELAAIGYESLTTQWRTVLSLGTHERMSLAQLWAYGPMPMSELASRISLSRAAVTSLVDRLEEDGWLRRVPDDHDRRRTVLHLNGDAYDHYRKVTDQYRDELAGIAADMDDEEWGAVTTFLERWHERSMDHADRLRASTAERRLL